MKNSMLFERINVSIYYREIDSNNSILNTENKLYKNNVNRNNIKINYINENTNVNMNKVNEKSSIGKFNMVNRVSNMKEDPKSVNYK